jgi:hypothetical protein
MLRGEAPNFDAAVVSGPAGGVAPGTVNRPYDKNMEAMRYQQQLMNLQMQQMQLAQQQQNLNAQWELRVRSGAVTQMDALRQQQQILQMQMQQTQITQQQQMLHVQMQQRGITGPAGLPIGTNLNYRPGSPEANAAAAMVGGVGFPSGAGPVGLVGAGGQPQQGAVVGAAVAPAVKTLAQQALQAKEAIYQVLECDRIHLLDGYENSRGAILELSVAQATGKEVSWPNYAVEEKLQPVDKPRTNLDEAKSLVYGDRNDAYGHPADDYERTARIWSAILGVEITAKQAVLCMAGVKIIHVPYKGAAPQIADVVGKHITMTFVSIGAALPFIESGRLRAIGVTSSTRVSALPNVPPISDTPGLAGFEVINFFGLMLPAGTPPAIVKTLNGASVTALKVPEIAAKLRENGFEPSPTTPDQFREFIRVESAKFGKIVVEAGVKAEQ